MTLPRDVARCHGATHPDLWGELWDGCNDCLRRTAPYRNGGFYSFIEPPALDPDGSCPYRIPPP